MACKKLIEEDRNGNEALKLPGSEKHTKIEDVKQEFQRRICDYHLHESEFSECFPILFIATQKVDLPICSWS